MTWQKNPGCFTNLFIECNIVNVLDLNRAFDVECVYCLFSACLIFHIHNRYMKCRNDNRINVLPYPGDCTVTNVTPLKVFEYQRSSYYKLEAIGCRSAIEEGKGIFYNIKNFVRFQLSTYVLESAIVSSLKLSLSVQCVTCWAR